LQYPYDGDKELDVVRLQQLGQQRDSPRVEDVVFVLVGLGASPKHGCSTASQFIFAILCIGSVIKTNANFNTSTLNLPTPV
jgi:hypothetical protein